MKFELSSILLICGGGAVFAVLLFLVSARLAALMQQCGYEGRRFLKWYFSKDNIQRKRLSLLTLSLVLLTALLNVCFSFAGVWAANLISAAPVFLLVFLYLFSERKYALKVPAKKTARLLRLKAAEFVLLLLFSVGLGFAFFALSLAVEAEWFALLRFVPVTLLTLLLPFVMTIANGLMKAYEIPHNRRFVRRAAKLLSTSSCKKVGITGSFGKTSVKHFAAQLLSEKYKVVATPASFNTPMGIARTVFEEGLDCDVFLAEMGARHEGDIGELCDLVQPGYGVVTGVCEQHIETFLTLENIKREKGVLAARAERCVLGKTVADLSAKDALREGEDFRIENLVCTCEGSSFDLLLQGERIGIETSLLGKNAAEDVALAAALCLLLGMSAEEIARAARNLQPVPHRLQKIEANGLFILDDSYNSNIAGAKDAVETLRLFPGKKMVVTPGLVELGQLEEKLNAELGGALVGLDVLLVGETLVLPVRKGYSDAGGDEKRIRIVPTLQKAQEILSAELSAGDSVLFLNDLPDLYR